MSEVIEADVLIVGQGAAAYAAGLYSARYQVKTVVAAEQFGGETAIGGVIENYPGTGDIDGFALMLKFKEQVDKLEVPTLNSNVASVSKNGNRFKVELEDGTIVDPCRDTRCRQGTQEAGPATRRRVDGQGGLILLDMRRTAVPQ